MSLDQLTVINLPPGSSSIEEFERAITIHTCQRTIIAGFIDLTNHKTQNDVYIGTAGYKFLLEVICGLKSKIIAEYEIVSQFKESYHHYLGQDATKKDGSLIKILEKLFKDSKEIRTKYLLGISHESYAGITKKILLQNYFRQQENTENTITILGSGKLAEDIIKNTTKKFRLNIVARNAARLDELKTHYGINPILLNDETSLAAFPCLVNTIGTENILFHDDNLFAEWNQLHSNKIFIDLGSPSCINSRLRKSDGVYLLNDFFEAAQNMNLEKKQKIELARIAIDAIVIKREMIFKKSWAEAYQNLFSLKGLYPTLN